MYGFAIMHAAKVYLCCLKSWDILRKFWKKLHNAIHIHGHIRHLPLRKLLAPDIHRIEGIPAVREVFKQVFIRLRLLFHHSLVVFSKRKSLIVHIHAPFATARHSPNKQVCSSLRLPCTNVRISPEARGLSSSRNRAALLSQAGADMARGIASWEQRQSSDLQNLVSQRGAEIFK